MRRYFEKILKGTQTSLWVRNVQLGLISIVIGLVGVYTKDRAALQGPDRGGFFQGYRSAPLCLSAFPWTYSTPSLPSPFVERSLCAHVYPFWQASMFSRHPVNDATPF